MNLCTLPVLFTAAVRTAATASDLGPGRKATEESDSGLFVASDDLCPPALAGCADAGPCYDHTTGICDATTGVMDTTGEAAGCAAALPSCGGCFPGSRCGLQSAADSDEPLDISPDALAYLGATHTCIYGGSRCFYTYVPDCASENAPLVLDMHGYGSSPLLSSFYTGWVEKATENCFVLVLPLGRTDPSVAEDTCWGLPGGLAGPDGAVSPPCCCNVNFQPTVTDDADFLRDAVAVAVQRVPEDTEDRVVIDTTRIYMAGHSNGCMAAIAMAILHSDVVAAVGCHAGAALAPFPDSYDATPIMMVHGKEDLVVGYNGGGELPFLSTMTAHSLIAEANGCADDEETRMVDLSTNNYTTYTAASCQNNATVVLLALDGVGHFPYKGTEEVDPSLIEPGTLPTKIDTTQMAWDFVKLHSSAVAPELNYDDDQVPASRTPTVSPVATSTTASPVSQEPTASTVTTNPVANQTTESPTSSSSSVDFATCFPLVLILMGFM